MSEYTPSREEVFGAWESTLWEGVAGEESMNDANWDGGRMRAQLSRWLADELAKAWDEGFEAGERDVMQHESWDEPCIENPYRKAE